MKLNSDIIFIIYQFNTVNTNLLLTCKEILKKIYKKDIYIKYPHLYTYYNLEKQISIIGCNVTSNLLNELILLSNIKTINLINCHFIDYNLSNHEENLNKLYPLYKQISIMNHKNYIYISMSWPFNEKNNHIEYVKTLLTQFENKFENIQIQNLYPKYNYIKFSKNEFYKIIYNGILSAQFDFLFL